MEYTSNSYKSQFFVKKFKTGACIADIVGA